MDSFDLDQLVLNLAPNEVAVEGEFALLDPATGLLHAGKEATGLRTLGLFRTRVPVTGAADGSTLVAVRNLRYVLAANSEDNPVEDIYTTVYVEGPATVGASATGTSIAGTVLRVDERGVTVKITGF